MTCNERELNMPRRDHLPAEEDPQQARIRADIRRRLRRQGVPHSIVRNARTMEDLRWLVTANAARKAQRV